MATCSECGDVGVINLPDDKLVECKCSLIKRIAAKMPSHIRMTKVTKRHLALPICRMEKESVFIISRWADMRAIIKAIMIKNHKMLIQITSDREIRDVGVGSTSRTARADDDVHAIYNSISDLVDTADLTIIRLNELKYKNKAAAGLLEEAITYRVDRMKPTWVVSDPTDPYGVSSQAFSQSVWELLHTCFEKFEVPQIMNVPAPPTAPKPGKAVAPMPLSNPEDVPVLELEPLDSLASKYESKGSKPEQRGQSSYKKKRSDDDDSGNKLLNMYSTDKSSKKKW